MSHPLQVLVATPAHSGLGFALTYESEQLLAPGSLVRVPLGQREVLGVVWEPEPLADSAAPSNHAKEIRCIAGVLSDVPPLSQAWLRLIRFAAHYYQRSAGEVALAALPPQLRELSAQQMAKRLKKPIKDNKNPKEEANPEPTNPTLPVPTAEQTQALAQFEAEPGPFLLFGTTGSGKTEVYLRAVQAALSLDTRAQALVLVPEINLTPQLQARFEARFTPLYGAQAVVPLHSGMTQPQRLKSWLAAHLGHARIVLGTRLAVLASLPGLRLIVVDEEHDPSYKSQDGARYSARDLAVWRGKQENAKVLLGSATPSLETWQACETGRYARLNLVARVGDAPLPAVQLIDMRVQPRKTVLAPVLVAAIAECVARGEQALVFLNRRGYAPVLACSHCEWKSDCNHCSAFRVFHKLDRSLRCHHCGDTSPVPRACPVCGNPDIVPLGRGTEQLEEELVALLSGLTGPSGQPIRVLRLDADSTRQQGALSARLAQVHAGEVDVLVGTQMVTKGHDFRRITLVAAIQTDSALFSSDFRAPERLFSLLVQAAGRAGRSATSAPARMWVQTQHPGHPLFAALKRYDYPGFAAQQLRERLQAGMPPFAYQALLRADARSQEAAQAFLNQARAAAALLDSAQGITLYPPVPLTIARVANIERAHLLIECPSRPALQRFLAAWHPVLRATKEKGLIRWAVDVDPLGI
jgi:primosomal protein N' (replication factor Y) (superfamily II helicase)